MRSLRPALQSSQGRSRNWSGASLVNCFAEKADGDKREDFAVLATPGLTQWANVGVGPVRGAVTLGGVLYVISGGFFYSVDSGGTATLIGAVTGAGKCRMATNYNQIAFVAGSTGTVYAAGALTNPLLFFVKDVLYADGYMLWSVFNSEQFFISALDNALVYDAADIASVEGFPDNIVGAINDHREIQFFGEKTTEIFYNSGQVDFPFQRQGNAFIERGCFDRDSIVKIDNSITFMGDDRIIYTLVGYQPQRISTHAIEYQLRDATYARGWTYSWEGHKFYVLEVDRGTFVFDFATGAWHQRQSFGSTWWRAGGAVDAYGLTLFTDRATGQLFSGSPDVFTENGGPIAYEITLPTVDAGGERAAMNAFEVVCETGVGNSDVADPKIMLQYSDDNGHLWSNEMWRSLGAIGTYRTRAVWRGLGLFRQRQMKLRITDAVRRLVISYRADIS